MQSRAARVLESVGVAFRFGMLVACVAAGLAAYASFERGSLQYLLSLLAWLAMLFSVVDHLSGAARPEARLASLDVVSGVWLVAIASHFGALLVEYAAMAYVLLYMGYLLTTELARVHERESRGGEPGRRAGWQAPSV